jgi:hypothetical protein
MQQRHLQHLLQAQQPMARYGGDSGSGTHLHDVTQLCRMQVLLWHWPEEVHAALVDAQD